MPPAPAVANKISLPKYAKCRAIYDYEASDADELSFREGDVIDIIQEGLSSFLCV